MPYKNLIIALTLLLSIPQAHAKRWYFAESEVTCKEGECVVNATQAPLTGTLRSYYDDGKTAANTDYLNGKKHGNALAFYPDGELKSRSFYLLGVEEGVRLEYYSNGNRKRIVRLKNGKFNGEVLTYDEEATLIKEQFFDNGRLQGWSREYYDNGRLALEVYYEQGEVAQAFCQTNGGRRQEEVTEEYRRMRTNPCLKGKI
jgi:antitoxin component YwqK of YwqJK toxin-antitoxin module